MNYELEVSRSLPAVFDSLSSGETRRNLASPISSSATLGPLDPTTNGVTKTSGVSFSGQTWTRLVRTGTAAGNNIARTFTNLAELVNGETYSVSYVVYNEGASAANVTIDWADAGSAPYTIQPAQTRTITTTSTRATYDNTYRFSDFELNGAGSLLVRDVIITRGTATGAYFDGNTSDTTFKSYEWSGAANASSSIELSSAPPLVAGSGTSALLGAPHTIPFSAWNKGAEDVAFSLEVWHLPIANTGELIVMGHITEGLFWDGDEYILRVIYDDNTTLESRWRPVEVKSRHLVVAYDAGSFTVFADALPVITLEALRDRPFKAIGPINLNNGTGTGQYDSAALYYRALPYSEILAHFTWGRAVAPARDIAAANGGTTWTLSSIDENKYDTIIYDESSWNLGNAQGVSYFKDLVAESEAGGTWQVALPVNTIDGAVLGGIALSYAGQGITMSYSTDGVAWTAIPNRSVIMQDAVADGSMLFLQFILADGDAWLNSVTVEILANREMSAHSGQRVLTFKSAHMARDLVNQLEYQENDGANLRSGFLEIQEDTQATPTNIGTIEMWAKMDDLTGTVFVIAPDIYATTFNGSLSYSNVIAAYRNGSPNVGPVSLGVWEHWVFVLSNLSPGPMRVGNSMAGSNPIDMTVAHLATYDYKLSAAQALSLYQQNLGASILRVDDTSQITLSEEASGPKFFANNWSYVSGGS